MDVGNFVIDWLKKRRLFLYTNAYVMRTWFSPMVRFLFKYLVALFHPYYASRNDYCLLVRVT